jgi:predicted GNAT superfamily acetyltransferase
VLGAYVADRLVGFSVGHAAWSGHGRPYLYSKILGVDARFRGGGIGRRLKLLQRHHALRHGYREIVWTFDPLVRASGVLNIGHLGVRATRYEPNFYGEGGIGGIHEGFSSDRLVVSWPLTSARVENHLRRRRMPVLAAGTNLPWLITADPRRQAPRVPRAVTGRWQRAVVAIPADIDVLKKTSLPQAEAWRRAYRRVLVTLLDDGAVIDDIAEVDSGSGTALAYVVRRPTRGKR